MSPGFRKLDEHEVYRHWLMSFRLATFESPEGERFERGVMRLPGAVATVPVDGDEVVLVRQFRASIGELLLEIPAGMCDVDGEPHEVTAGRELAEEVGLQAARLEPLVSFLAMPGSSDHLTTIFLARDLTPCDHDRHGPEEGAMTVERYPLADAPRLIAEGQVRDSKTIIGLLLARERMDP